MYDDTGGDPDTGIGFKALIFDLDGVVVDSEPLHERATVATFDRFHLDVPAGLLDAFKGKTDRDIMGHVADAYGDGRLDVDTLLAYKRDAYAGIFQELQMIPGALAFIQRVADVVPLALTTSATRNNQGLAFDRFALHAYFGVVVTGDDVRRPKPDPEPYRITVERLGRAPSECLILEDSVNGVRSGVGAGCTVAALTTSFGAPVLRDAGAHLVVEGYDELARRLLGRDAVD